MPRLAWLITLALAASARAAEIRVENDVPVRMRDGVVLRADVWRPAAEGRFPVLVYRTPYDRRRAPESYTTFRRAVERGYAVVIQDVRGRYGSGGEYEPYRHEGPDGYDTIEWAAVQPWSDGAVGTFGLSYPGAVQWLAALLRPPHLKAMAPAMTYATTRNFFHSGGVFDLSWAAWIWNNIAPDTRARKGLDGPKTGEEARAAWERIRESVQSRLPLSDVPELRDVAPYYFEWMRHPPGDPWWDWAEVRGRYGSVTAAVLNLSGWHDEAYGPDGALNNFAGLATARGRDPRTRVVMGPWVHGVDAVGQTRSGEREFGPAAALDYDALVLDWMDLYVRGVERPPVKPVKVFVMGRNQWREDERWPLPAAQPRPLYLEGPKAGRRGVLGWTAPGSAESSSVFVSDPARPVVDPHAPKAGAHDYRSLAEREDVLTFETPPLPEDLEVTGPIQATIFLESDAPDTDLWVKLFDVAPDGTAFNLMSPGLDVLRASYRGGGPERALLEPGRIYELTFTDLVTANVFASGHRLRVCLLSSFLPHFSRNLHTGKLETESAETRTARIRIHHDRAHPSRLLLPVIPSAGP